MSIKVHDATNHNGLFDVLGIAFQAIATLNTARGATVPSEALEILSQFALVPPTTGNADVMQGLADSLASWQSGGGGLTSSIQFACQNLLASFVQADTTTVNPSSLQGNLQYLITQMIAGGALGGDHVAANAPGFSGSAVPAANAGDLAIDLDTTQGDGTAGQNAVAEVLSFSVASTASTVNPAIVANSPAAYADRLSYLWPGGSGLQDFGVSTTDPASSLLSNGQFETDSNANLPDSWIPTVATPGTTLKVTSACVQTLTITGGDGTTAGTYIITWEDASGITWGTAPITFAGGNAAAVQAALNGIAELSGVTVSSTGSAPNFTHTITFSGIGGSVADLATTSYSGTTPTITQAVATAADANSYEGQSLVIAGNGSELTTLYQALPALQPNTVYFLSFRANVPVTPAGGVLAVSITQGIGSTAAVDAQGNNGSKSIALSGTSPGWTEFHFTFRLSPNMPSPCYLKVALTTALSNAKTVYLDNFALAQGQQLYNGGPYVAAFLGRAASDTTDAWSYTITNTWSNSGSAGLQTWFNQVFGMADLGLLLPTAASTTAPAWATSTAYTPGEEVIHSGTAYVCLVGHTSGTFATDLGNGDWTATTIIADSLIT